MLAPELQVKQYVAEVEGVRGSRWWVFKTAAEQYYLFVCKQNTDFQVPVRKADLRDDVRSALAHGFGHA